MSLSTPTQPHTPSDIPHELLHCATQVLDGALTFEQAEQRASSAELAQLATPESSDRCACQIKALFVEAVKSEDARLLAITCAFSMLLSKHCSALLNSFKDD